MCQERSVRVVPTYKSLIYLLSTNPSAKQIMERFSPHQRSLQFYQSSYLNHSRTRARLLSRLMESY